MAVAGGFGPAECVFMVSRPFCGGLVSRGASVTAGDPTRFDGGISNCRRRGAARTLGASVRCWRTKASSSTRKVGWQAVHRMSLEDLALASPILGSCGFFAEDVRAGWSFWIDVAGKIMAHLKFNPGDLDTDKSQRTRVYQYYLPVFMWCHKQLIAHKIASGSSTPAPLVIGISAPQGCGKSTIVACLQDVFNSLGMAAASISIDDFYLTCADQTALAKANPDNPLVQLRGNACTHDVPLGTTTLTSLRSLTDTGRKVQVPRYDKSKNQGRGDRADQACWPVVEGPLSVVLFEGWMLGFRPVEAAEAAAVDTNLGIVNETLKGYEAAWDSFVDCWLVVKVQDPEYVFKWRLEAEQAMRASGQPGMTDEQVKDFVTSYMPAYRAYLPGLYSKGPTTAMEGKVLMIEVDKNRALADSQAHAPV
ncbi:unnamed protein product [Ostreobium quekettii]|uniref:Phosphoribulokinase/uridine kinase domain-containing protein n=1 Tax=Ostreobium quekettii TaxID=121088 RepID=A0A8S1JAJ3_9CHLO|nr:unnamed protein product [Ostreobium quekettii]|eukprot:evm.model.scf_2229EXC.2 EVM.evm.TU.scf_2229EXC.2   scf_2229EXC:5958-8229(+)